MVVGHPVTHVDLVAPEECQTIIVTVAERRD
jgi:hypothetical protein